MALPFEHLVAIVEDRHALHEKVAQRSARRAHVIGRAETFRDAYRFLPEQFDLRDLCFVEGAFIFAAPRDGIA